MKYLTSSQKQGIVTSEHEVVFPWQCHDELSEKMGANFSLLLLLQLHMFPQNPQTIKIMAPMKYFNFVYNWANTKFACDLEMQYLLLKHLLLSLYPTKQMQNQKKFKNSTHEEIQREGGRGGEGGPFPFSSTLLPIWQAPFPRDPINSDKKIC